MDDTEISKFLKPTEPLGPTRHERINMRLGDKHSNLLVFRTALFDKVTEAKHPIIAGRRGSGKTAVVNALVANSSGEPYSWGVGEVDLEDKNIVVFLNSYKRFDILVERVGQDLSHLSGDWLGMRPETSARYWTKHLWQEIFDAIYERDIVDNPEYDYVDHLVAINKVVTGRDVVDRSRPLTPHTVDQAVEQAKAATLNYLRDDDLNCVIVIDSFEEYPLKSPRFEKVVSGLFRCVNDFSDMYERCFVYCCLPEEVEPILRLSVPNVVKDGSEASSLSRLRWRPIDLLGVAAKRYKEFLKLYLDPKKASEKRVLDAISSLSLDVRVDLNALYKLILPDVVINRYGCAEPTLAYLIRHTQLLPREILTIISSAVIKAHDRTSEWTSCNASDVAFAIEKNEADFAQQVLKPFRANYPTLCEQVGSSLSNSGIKPIFRGEDLERLNGLQGMCRHETSDVIGTLYHMGVVGYIQDGDKRDSLNELYVYGNFHYNSTKPPVPTARNMTFCVHPIFSGAWHLRQAESCKDMKFVYPADTPFELLGD